MGFTRRGFLHGVGIGAPLALAGCAFDPRSSSTDRPSTDRPSTDKFNRDVLLFSTWGTEAELASFQRAIDRFELANDGKRVALNSVPYELMLPNIDTQLLARNPPDIFRLPYQAFGRYAGRSQLLNLRQYLPDGSSQRFTEAAWAAVQHEGAPYGLPRHTDTSVLFYNVDLFASAGITDVPSELSRAWTWEEFEAVLEALKTDLPEGKYPFAHNWRDEGVTRWLSWLFAADGRLLAENLTGPAIDSKAGRAALEYTKNLFD